MPIDWTQIWGYSFQTVWVEFVAVVPQILIAIAVLALGWFVGGVLQRIVMRFFKKLNVDALLDAAGVDVITERAGYTLNSGLFVGTLVKWFIIIVFFVAALDILNLSQASDFLSTIVLGYLPQVIVAVLILFGGCIVAAVVKKAVIAGGKATSFASPQLLGAFAYYAILTVTVLAALNQLEIAPELVQMLFAGLVFGVSLAFGLAFGLGGKETAATYLSKIAHTRDTTNNHR